MSFYKYIYSCNQCKVVLICIFGNASFEAVFDLRLSESSNTLLELLSYGINLKGK